jgi:hypothetical protein
LLVKAAEIQQGTAIDAAYSVQVNNMAQVSGANTAAKGLDSTDNITISVKQLPSVGPLVTGSLSVVPGATITMDVTIPPQADMALGYQWRLNGIPIKGQTSKKLSAVISNGDQEGAYDVVVSNKVGSRISESKVVSLNQRPAALVSDLPPKTLLEGAKLVWSGFAASGDNLVYRWTKAGVEVKPPCDCSNRWFVVD